MMRLYGKIFFWSTLATVMTTVVAVGLTTWVFMKLEDRYLDWRAMAEKAVELYDQGGIVKLKPLYEHWHNQRISMFLLDRMGRGLVGPSPLPRITDNLSTEYRHFPLRLGGEAIHVLQQGKTESYHVWFLVPPEYLRIPVPGSMEFFSLVGVQILVALAVIGGVCFFFTRLLTRPILALRLAAQRLARGDPMHHRVAASLTERDDELGDLSRDFNRMADHLLAHIERQKRLVRDISHEIRSPLARLNLVVELARRQGSLETNASLARMEREIGVIDHLVGEILTLARLEGHPEGIRRQPLDLVALCGRIADDAAFEATERQVTVDVLHSAPIEQVQADPAMLACAVENTVRNAIRHATPGSAVTVTLRQTATTTTIGIGNRGPTISEVDRARMFEPFFRVDAVSEGLGHGVGLAIVDRVMRVHGGFPEVLTHPEGGVIVELSLPR
ncbi:MAG: HAMP domain-containing histidine kinase [Magnetococcales bacterium]|nr:HAMP domain-containing histidine kinase [Magnetococcales bacterium]